MSVGRLDTLNSRRTLVVDGRSYDYFSLDVARDAFGDLSRLPFSLKVLLENLLRWEDGRTVTIDDMKAVSAALFAALGLGGNGSRSHFDLPVSAAEQRCEMCDRQRMAECPMPHCRHRRTALGGD